MGEKTLQPLRSYGVWTIREAYDLIMGKFDRCQDAFFGTGLVPYIEDRNRDALRFLVETAERGRSLEADLVSARLGEAAALEKVAILEAKIDAVLQVVGKWEEKWKKWVGEEQKWEKWEEEWEKWIGEKP